MQIKHLISLLLYSAKSTCLVPHLLQSSQEVAPLRVDLDPSLNDETIIPLTPYFEWGDLDGDCTPKFEITCLNCPHDSVLIDHDTNSLRIKPGTASQFPIYGQIFAKVSNALLSETLDF